MGGRPNPFRLTFMLAAISVLALVSSDAWAQATSGNTAGVVVDAQGVLRVKVFRDPNPMLARQRLAAARASLSPEMAQPSALRKVSLTRLEAVIAQRIQKAEGLTDDMKYLAGLTRVKYVFFYPETNDIVIAGPAEGYMASVSGRVIGMTSGRAVLELQDLIVALRAFPPSGRGADVISVSIDPTQEGLARMQQFTKNIPGLMASTNPGTIAAGLRQSLGLQTVTIQGVSSNTHFAQVLVEADYRMKLIGIGLEAPPVKIATYVQRATPGDVARNALQRWYFVPDYECVRVTADGAAMELVGEGVKLVNEDELVTAAGGRVTARRADRAAQMFVQSFTRMYPVLAERSPVYAQLRNLIDMAIAAAFIQQQDYCNQAGWNMGVFVDEQQLPV